MKVNQSGVMPIIFASSLLAFPQTIALFMGENAQNFVSTYLSTSGDIGFWIYRSLEVLLIVFFYFKYIIYFLPVSSNSYDTSIHSTFYECKHEFSRYININRCRGST